MSEQIQGEPAPKPRKKHTHLTPGEAEALRRDHAEHPDWPFYLLGHFYEVSPQTAWNICRGQRKRDVKAAQKKAAAATP